jgi:hypothetical protein
MTFSMSLLPHVTAVTRERIAREFDDLGPAACLAEITEDLRQHNPELLDIISKSAADLGQPLQIMQGFGMFYRLLVMQSRADIGRSQLHLLPRVTPETRDLIVAHIDAKGSETFTMECIEDLEKSNPELLQMAHNFASRHADYLGVMQGFGLLYRSLFLQSFADRAWLH